MKNVGLHILFSFLEPEKKSVIQILKDDTKEPSDERRTDCSVEQFDHFMSVDENCLNELDSSHSNLPADMLILRISIQTTAIVNCNDIIKLYDLNIYLP